jgi:hypothetical protein
VRPLRNDPILCSIRRQPCTNGPRCKQCEDANELCVYTGWNNSLADIAIIRNTPKDYRTAKKKKEKPQVTRAQIRAALDDTGLRLATPEFEDALDTAPPLDALLHGTLFDTPETLPQPETSWFQHEQQPIDHDNRFWLVQNTTEDSEQATLEIPARSSKRIRTSQHITPSAPPTPPAPSSNQLSRTRKSRPSTSIQQPTVDSEPALESETRRAPQPFTTFSCSCLCFLWKKDGVLPTIPTHTHACAYVHCEKFEACSPRIPCILILVLMCIMRNSRRAPWDS